MKRRNNKRTVNLLGFSGLRRLLRTNLQLYDNDFDDLTVRTIVDVETLQCDCHSVLLSENTRQETHKCGTAKIRNFL